MTVSLAQIALATLKFADKPVTDNNVRSLVIWACSPSTNNVGGTKAQWNPWDLTVDEEGASQFNNSGVKNYPSIEIAIEAFWDSLNNGKEPSIVTAIEASAPPAETLQLVVQSDLGSQPSSAIQQLVLSDWNKYALLAVGGSTDENGAVVTQGPAQDNTTVPPAVETPSEAVAQTPSETVAQTPSEAVAQTPSEAEGEPSTPVTETSSIPETPNYSTYLRSLATQLNDIANEIEGDTNG